jgi:hypothetical protein
MLSIGDKLLFCEILDKLYQECYWDIKLYEHGTWFPVETKEYSADPEHAKWHRKFLRHKSKCRKCKEIKKEQKIKLKDFKSLVEKSFTEQEILEIEITAQKQLDRKKQ